MKYEKGKTMHRVIFKTDTAEEFYAESEEELRLKIKKHIETLKKLSFRGVEWRIER